MKNIQKELSDALAILSRFSLSGPAVDAMADAKRHIRIAQGIAKKYEEELEGLEAKEDRGDG